MTSKPSEDHSPCAAGSLASLPCTKALEQKSAFHVQVPKILELVGLGYTAWFVYRYLLFKVPLPAISDGPPLHPAMVVVLSNAILCAKEGVAGILCEVPMAAVVPLFAASQGKTTC